MRLSDVSASSFMVSHTPTPDQVAHSDVALHALKPYALLNALIAEAGV